MSSPFAGIEVVRGLVGKNELRFRRERSRCIKPNDARFDDVPGGPMLELRDEPGRLPEPRLPRFTLRR